MAEDERLREALLELQFLRDREARRLEETRTLLECLEAYSTAATAGDALASVFLSLRQKIGADVSLLIAQGADGGALIKASDDPSNLGKVLIAPVDLFSRPRNLSDLHLLGDWAGDFDLTGATGTIVAPTNGTLALVALRHGGRSFRKPDLNLVERLSGFAAQALSNSELAAENELLAATISGSSSGFAIADATQAHRPLVYVNTAFETLSGYSSEEVLGENCRFLTAEPESSPERQRLREAVANCDGGTFLLRNRRKSGEEFWNELTLFPVRDADGRARHLVATQSDVSERVTAAMERDLARERMESALAATEDAFLVLDGEDRVVFANRSVDHLFPAAPLNWRPRTRFTDNWAAYLAACADLPGRITSLVRKGAFRSLLDTPSGQEIDLPDGRTVLLRAGSLDGGGLVLSATDITPMRSAQNLLSQRLAAIEAATDGIAITDADDRLVYLNRAAGQLLNFATPIQGLGRRWRSRYDDANTAESDDAFPQTFSQTRDAQVVTHEVSGSRLAAGGSVIIIRDATEELRAAAREKEMTQELIRLQRQEAIATLTAGIAHDFNNLLSAINGSAVLISMADNLPPEVSPHLDRISAAGVQSAKLVSRLLDIGAGHDAQGAFELSSVLKDIPPLVETSLPGSVDLHIADVAETLALRGSPGSLNQILINTILNARDAIGTDRGKIRVAAQPYIGRAEDTAEVGRIETGRTYARISVQDTGAGMDLDTAAKVFRPFFTTKGRSGNGLGLATAAMQLQSVGGAVGLSSEPEVGTTITLYWPLAQHQTAEPGVARSTVKSLEHMTILLVDDDPKVSEVICGYLEALGAEVAACEDPRDAIAAIEDDPNAWSALITDYDMPEMNGGALAERAMRCAPGLPVIVVTALAKRLSDPRLTNGQAAAILPKPIDLDGLARSLAAIRMTG